LWNYYNININEFSGVFFSIFLFSTIIVTATTFSLYKQPTIKIKKKKKKFQTTHKEKEEET
jgi:hypothetical protein